MDKNNRGHRAKEVVIIDNFFLDEEDFKKIVLPFINSDYKSLKQNAKDRLIYISSGDTYENR